MKRSFALALAAAILPPALAAQQHADATFAVLLGPDTIVVEQTSRMGTRLEGNMIDRLRGSRWQYVLTYGAQGESERLENSFYRAASDTTPAQRATIAFRGDSAIVEAPPGGAAQRIATRAGAVPWVNPSAAMLEQILRRAKAIGGASARVPIIQVQGGQTIDVAVTWMPGDSATVSMGGVTFRAAVGPDGTLLGATVPSQNVRITRAEGIHAATVRPPDYSAPAGAPYTAEEVVVRTPTGVSLAGTLTVPKARAARGAPAVVLITGSGPENRDEEIGIPGYRPFRQIADTLGRRGIAVLRLDDRGVGGSDAGPSATSADFADDVRAALALLRVRSEIDGARLGLVGHSEGGLIAPMVAAQDTTLRGIVLLAGPAHTGRRIIAYQNRYGVQHSSAITAAQRDSVLRAAAHSVDSMSALQPWLRFFLDYDPKTTARRVKTPVLVLQGATDRQVTAEQADTLAAALRAGGNRRVTVRVFPATNHLFLADPDGNPAGYRALPSKSVRPEVLGAIAEWLTKTLR